MSYPMRVKARARENSVEILALISHPMDTGETMRSGSGTRVPPRYIETVRFRVNGVVAAEARLGPGVARNPLTAVRLKSASVGDKITVDWVDNRGGHGNAGVVVD